MTGGGGALFTISGSAGKLLIIRTHMDSAGNPSSNEAYIHSETVDKFKSLHFRIISYNQIIGLFSSQISKLILMTVTFTDSANPTLSPISGKIML